MRHYILYCVCVADKRGVPLNALDAIALAAPEVAASLFPPTEAEWVSVLSFFRDASASQGEVSNMATAAGKIGYALVRGEGSFDPNHRFQAESIRMYQLQAQRYGLQRSRQAKDLDLATILVLQRYRMARAPHCARTRMMGFAVALALCTAPRVKLLMAMRPSKLEVHYDTVHHNGQSILAGPNCLLIVYRFSASYCLPRTGQQTVCSVN